MKHVFLLGQVWLFILAASEVLNSYYIQYVEALQPCPLCLMQRGMMIGLLFCAVFGMLFHARKRRYVAVWFEFLFAAGGLFFALRQLWLQALPPAETGMCLPGVEMLIHRLPWHEVMHAFVWGSSSGCGEVHWTFAGLSMAAWSALSFASVSVLLLIIMIKCYRHDRLQN